MAKQPPPFEFDAVIDYEKVAESCDWMCLADYFREALPEFLRQLTAGGYALVKLPEMVVDSGAQAGWPIPDISRWAEIFIRHSDGRIGIDSVPTPLDTPEQAAATGAALIAAAQYVQEKNR